VRGVSSVLVEDQFVGGAATLISAAPICLHAVLHGSAVGRALMSCPGAGLMRRQELIMRSLTTTDELIW
jgi:hypothetical protein